MTSTASTTGDRPLRCAISAAAILVGMAFCFAICGASGCNNNANQPQTSGAQSAAGADAEIEPREPTAQEMAQQYLELTWTNPEGWTSRVEYKVSRVDTWTIEGAEETLDAYAFSFGDTVYQSVDSSLGRWSGLIRVPEGVEKPEPIVESWDQEGLHVTVATFTGQSITGIPHPEDDQPRGLADARLMTAIVEGSPTGFLFFQMSGPAEAVDAHRTEFLELIRSVRPTEAQATP